MSQNLRNYTKALYGFDAVVQRVPADQWDAASPCDGWCARDVVAHTAGVLDAVAEMARTGAVAMPEMPDPGSDVVALWNTSRDNVLDALDQPGVVNQVGEYWFGEATIDDILGFSQWDTLTHAWDLGQATGLDAHSSQELAEAGLATIGPIADGLRAAQLMGDQVEVAADADAMSRFLGLTGRTPAG
ncbi:MAG: TIGR03086 family metal-binding protein [Acidimicrobiales bacterium]